MNIFVVMIFGLDIMRTTRDRLVVGWVLTL